MSTDQPLSQLELEAVEVITAARGLADKLEQMLVTVLQSRMDTAPTPQPEPVKPGFNVLPCITQLADQNAVIAWPNDDASILELRSYAFMSIVGKANGQVAFQYLTANYPKTFFQKHVAPEVYEALEPGKIHIVHTGKRKGRNYWDYAIAPKMNDKEILARARLLARFYGELQGAGRI